MEFDIKEYFIPSINKWLETNDSKAIEWVDRAVRGDSFKPENDEMKQSTSAVDLFHFVGEAVDFLKKLQWPDPLQMALFATTLAGVYLQHVRSFDFVDY
jgi:MUN domain